MREFGKILCFAVSKRTLPLGRNLKHYNTEQRIRVGSSACRKGPSRAAPRRGSAPFGRPNFGVTALAAPGRDGIVVCSCDAVLLRTELPFPILRWSGLDPGDIFSDVVLEQPRTSCKCCIGPEGMPETSFRTSSWSGSGARVGVALLQMGCRYCGFGTPLSNQLLPRTARK